MSEECVNDHGDSIYKVKGVIIIGGHGKGGHFRPLLSLELPPPLFPIGGFPIVYHHIELCSKVKGMVEIILIGYYHQDEQLSQLIYEAKLKFKIQIRYLQEFAPLGTAGGLYHFRDQILLGNPDYFFVINSDVCGAFDLNTMLDYHLNLNARDHFSIMTTEATRQQSTNYGCIVYDKKTNEILHYVEKPSTFVSTTINCGVYLFCPVIFTFLRVAFLKHQEENYNYETFDILRQCNESICMEKEVFQVLAGYGKLYMFPFNDFWSQIKSVGALIYSNRHMLQLYHSTHPRRLAVNQPGGPKFIGDVYVHPTVTIDPTAVIGPNVSISKHCSIGAGVRLRECIILQGATIRDRACILNSVVGWNVVIGEWTRIEGTSNDPNPNKPFAKMDMIPLFNEKGQLNPSITLIGSYVDVPGEIVILNSIVLPHKELNESIRNEIIL